MERKKYTIIESVIQGSMPLFIMSIIDRVDGFLMHTTAPWLFRQYNDIVFRKNYNFLRDMETLIWQNDLFEWFVAAKNVYYSLFDDVRDTSGLYKNPDGTPFKYHDHFSWIYFYNNECETTIDGKQTTIME